MNKGFFADALASRPLLWEAMLRANSRPGASLSASCPAGPYAGQFLDLSGEGAASLLSWLAETPVSSRSGQDTRNTGFWDYAEESRRLALLDAETLAELSLVAGVALHAPEIARVLRREELLNLRAGIGEDLYRYALCRGQYQLGSVRRLFAQSDRSFPLAERCALHGNMAARLVATRWPEELANRMFLALPPLPEGREAPAFSEAEILEIWLALKKLLLKEVAPSWAPCFD